MRNEFLILFKITSVLPERLASIHEITANTVQPPGMQNGIILTKELRMTKLQNHSKFSRRVRFITVWNMSGTLFTGNQNCLFL